MPGHTPFCEIIQCIRLTINKATLKCNTGDLEEIIQEERQRERKERETGKRGTFKKKGESGWMSAKRFLKSDNTDS